MKTRKRESIADYEADLSDLIQEENQHQHSHNMVSLLLRSVAAKFGYKEANRLVSEYDLTNLYEIKQIPLDKKGLPKEK